MSARDGFTAVNGVSITRGEARSLALRLARDDAEADTGAARAAAATLDELAEGGGETTVAGEQARAIGAALEAWLGETNERVLGERLLELRRRLGEAAP